ncbi:hypothetical protein [Evansella cellulosilytica]|uniref:Uncharacterized protein n=1 Tax=Evansella cellulosilytica (strain ATCC 21833 / DSM 2522 / FERM P-1141 / JCM 9156 / N-4) TaxID=649639 RepID=E6TWP4_EVAC2|nr:hypothetical protein [Evansella cellulosilytica]ADU28727.1 hypothetical protein Bcell_0445 [Evansella cellulosilytica DSM 2522]
MTMLLFVALALGVVMITALELTESSTYGRGMKPFLREFKKALYFILPLFVLALIIYYIFLF